MDGQGKPMSRHRRERSPELSIVVPMHDEAANAAPLVSEIVAALRGRLDFEIVCVDDASSDGTAGCLAGLAGQVPELRVLGHARQCGQSAALRTGIRAARAPWIATLDGDGQNDPADIPRLLAERDAAGPAVGLVAGWRTTRRDTRVRRWSSRVANAVRGRLLHDDCPDTGCALKLFPRQAWLELPWFDHMHRFLPALFRREGWQVRNVPVNHRPRLHGRSKYGIGNRLWVGLVDLLGVAWLLRRHRATAVTELSTPSQARLGQEAMP